MSLSSPYKRGDLVGQKYEVRSELGIGGFGVVYLATFREAGLLVPVALKTFRDEYLADVKTRERFRTEARMWVDLARGPGLVQAFFVDEADGRLFIVMEYVPPDKDGLNTLDGHLRFRPPDLAQSLRWAIECCIGMEYAYSKGIRCHRDLKPANIMIGQGKSAKITDFGLAGAIGMSGSADAVGQSIQQDSVGLSGRTMVGTGFGTPTHMPPEQFTDAASCDERSDIYAFGVVLFQMASGGRLPFLARLPADDSEVEKARFGREMHRLHSSAPVPTLDSPLSTVIHRCMEKARGARFRSFLELRAMLEPILRSLTGEMIHAQAPESVSAEEWNARGVSLHRLGYLEEALDCYREALVAQPRLSSALLNTANTLISLERFAEAMPFCDRAIAPNSLDADVINNKGLCYHGIGDYRAALECFDQSIAVNPEDADFWYNRGRAASRLGRRDEALMNFDKALSLNPRYAKAWHEKGNVIRSCGGDPAEALRFFGSAIALDPLHTSAWTSRGAILADLGETGKAAECFARAIEIAPDYALAWYNKGHLLDKAEKTSEAAECYARAVECDKKLVAAWSGWGFALFRLGRPGDAARCLGEATRLDPSDSTSWFGRASAEAGLQHLGCAICCYRRYISLAGRDAGASAEYASERLRMLQAIHDKEAETPAAAGFLYLEGVQLWECGFLNEAVTYFDLVLKSEPKHAMAWYGRAIAADDAGQRREATTSYAAFLRYASVKHTEHIEHARERLHKLGGA